MRLLVVFFMVCLVCGCVGEGKLLGKGGSADCDGLKVKSERDACLGAAGAELLNASVCARIGNISVRDAPEGNPDGFLTGYSYLFPNG